MLWHYLIGLIFIFIVFGFYLCLNTSEYKFIGLSFFFCGILILFYLITGSLTFSWIANFRLIISMVFLCVGLYFCVIEFIIIRSAKIFTEDEFDFLIVHGAKIYGCTPSPSLLDRLEATLRYIHLHDQTTIVLTGAKWPLAKISEAQFMYQWLTKRGISPERLILEDRASNTLENLRFSMVEIRSRQPHNTPKIGLLTSDYHMQRVLYMARAEGIIASGIAVPTTQFFIRVNYFIREAIAMTEIYLFGVEGI